MLKPQFLYVSGISTIPKGQYIRPRHDHSVFELGEVLTGHTDSVVAHAWALRNYDNAEVVFSIGHVHFRNAKKLTYIIARDLAEFLASLHLNELNQRGGFIHVVNAETFHLEPDRDGQMKWFSKQPVQVMERPTFTSLKEVMSRGVKIRAEQRSRVKSN